MTTWKIRNNVLIITTQIPLKPRLKSRLKESLSPYLNPALLTDQQQRVLNLLKQRKCNKEIASELNISLRTVKFHVTNILRTLKIQNRHEIFTV